MSYINWKGIDSKTIKGLLIQELSPISKPQMRTSITQIDGKDGDIVEYLGYESYTKTISIALTRNYNINEIINYFNGDGKLILSNEPDKFYIAQIIDSIDYNKLINFKTAKVKFHVQPFKYLVSETPYILEINDEKSLKVVNKGYEQSKPVITIYGTGTIQLLINGLSVFSIDMDEDFITIDSEQEEAYHETTLKNRQMTGIFPSLKSGENIITWIGNLTKIEVQVKSRWL